MYKISIVLSFYKPFTKSQFVFEKCIENLLNQTYSNFELLITNDGGNDQEAIAFISNIKDPRVIFYNFEKNSGGIPAIRYNEMIKKARGEYIFYAFEDDVINVDTLSLLFLELEKSNADYAYGQTIIHTQQGKLFFGASSGDILKYNYIPNNLILLKKSIFEKIGYGDESPNASQDSDWIYWQKLIVAGYKGVFVRRLLGECFGPLFGTNLRKGK
jgi:glycosyltransferase involved in cell wall biosynthesis